MNRRAASGCSTSSTTTPSTIGQLEHLQHGRRTPDAVQVRRRLRRAHARLPVAAVPLHPGRAQQDRSAGDPVQPDAAAGSSCTRRTTSARHFASTRKRGRSMPTTATSPPSPATVWSTSRSLPAVALVAGARVESFEQVVNTFDPFGLFVTHDLVGEQEHRLSSRRSTSCRRSRANRTCGSATARPSIAPSSASWRRSSSPTSSATAPSSGNPDLERALHPERRRALGDVPRRTLTSLAASVFFKYFDQPIERVVIAGAQPIVTFQNADKARNFGIELEAATTLFEHFFVSANYTFVDSQITLAARAADGADVAPSGRWRASRRTCST